MNEILKPIGKDIYKCKIVTGDDSCELVKVFKFMECKGQQYRPNRTRWENINPIRILESDDDYAYAITQGLNTSPEEIGIADEGYFDGKKHKVAPKILKIKSYVLRKFKGNLNDALLFKVILHPESPKENFDKTKENYFSSFSSLMLNQDVEDMLQLQRFDISGHPHDNCTQEKDFVTNSDEERELYLKYFSKQAGFPHFHFWNVNGLDKFAISADNLLKYIVDLLTEKDYRLNVYSLGMPFLYIKKRTAQIEEKVENKVFKGVPTIAPDRKDLYISYDKMIREIAGQTDFEADKQLSKDYVRFMGRQFEFMDNLNELFGQFKHGERKISSILIDCIYKLKLINFFDKRVVNSENNKNLSEEMFNFAIESELDLGNRLLGDNIKFKDYSQDNDDKEK